MPYNFGTHRMNFTSRNFKHIKIKFCHPHENSHIKISLVCQQVSLDSRVREIVNKNMVDPTPHTFDEAQLQIYTLMHRDSYPRFVNSHIFKRLAQLNNNSTIQCSGPGGAGSSSSPPPGAGGPSRKESFA